MITRQRSGARLLLARLALAPHAGLALAACAGLVRAACAGLVLAACSSDEPDAPPHLPPGRGRPVIGPVADQPPEPEPTPPATGPEPVADQIAQAQARLRGAGARPGANTDQAAPATTEGTQAEPAAKAADEPDLPGHLKNAMAGAPKCLAPKPQDKAQKRLDVAVTTHVMATGSVSRAEVSASSLTRPELECLKRMAQSVRFPSPVEGAPRRVQTTVTLELQPAKPAPQ